MRPGQQTWARCTGCSVPLDVTQVARTRTWVPECAECQADREGHGVPTPPLPAYSHADARTFLRPGARNRMRIAEATTWA